MPGISELCMVWKQLQVPHPFLCNICHASCSPSHSYGSRCLGAGLTLVLIQSHLHFFSLILQFVMFALHTDHVLQQIWISSPHYIAHKLHNPDLRAAIHATNEHIRWHQIRKGSQGSCDSLTLSVLTSLSLAKKANASDWHPSASLQVHHLGQNCLFLWSCEPTSSIPPRFYASCCSQDSCWAMSWFLLLYPISVGPAKAAKLLRNMLWAAKGLRSFAPSLYPSLLANSWPRSNDLFQASGLWDTKMLLFLPRPLSI